MDRIRNGDLQLAVCATCGTQFDLQLSKPPDSCQICDDPRQYVPPSGQSWTSLAIIQTRHKNVIQAMPGTNGRVYTIHTEPRFAIGQRAFLIRTPRGNILWDLVALLDNETISQLDALGGVNAIVISHPHYYTTHLMWSIAFAMAPVYLAAPDARWCVREDTSRSRCLINTTTHDILGSATVIMTGGHFPGSMVLLWEHRLFVADTVKVTPAGMYDGPRPPGTTTFSFLWSYPNQIPLPPPAISAIINAIDPFYFYSAHGAFQGDDVARDAKAKLLESARIVLAAMAGTMPGDTEAREFWKG